MLNVTVDFMPTAESQCIGNYLFQYSACRYYANKLNANYFIPRDRWFGDKFVDCQLEDFTICPQFPGGQKDIITLKGYFEDTKFYNPNWVKIKNDTNHLEYTEKYPPNEWIYIHMRCNHNVRAHYIISKTFQWTHVQYIKDSMKKMSDLTKIDKFLIITDDLNIAKTNVAAHSYLNTSFDFFILSKAKYLIITNSTFAWWAKTLGGNVKICMNNAKYYPFNWLRNTDSTLVQISPD